MGDTTPEKTHQLDAFIEHRGEKYRCEFKWQEKLIGYDDIALFIEKLDVVGISGLFISMSGFEEAAIRKVQEARMTKAVLLMDGEEVQPLMEGQVNFDEVLSIKRSYFDQRSQPYHRVVSLKEVG
ncbi:MAG: hypothetical protein ACREYF_29040 [Gammaproteobacteria bacterium]